MADPTEVPPVPVPVPEGTVPTPAVVTPPTAVEGAAPPVPAVPAPAEPAAAAPAPQEKPWYLGRIDELTRKLRETEAKVAPVAPVAPADPAAPQARLTEQEINFRAAQIAAETSFNEVANRVWTKGNTDFTDFTAKVTALSTSMGGLPKAFLEAVFETESPEKVIYELGKDLNKAYEIMSLSGPRQAVAVAKFAGKLSASVPAGAPQAPISNAPAPITPAVGSGGSRADATVEDTDTPIEQWMKLRNKQANGDARP